MRAWHWGLVVAVLLMGSWVLAYRLGREFRREWCVDLAVDVATGSSCELRRPQVFIYYPSERSWHRGDGWKVEYWASDGTLQRRAHPPDHETAATALLVSCARPLEALELWLRGLTAAD